MPLYNTRPEWGACRPPDPSRVPVRFIDYDARVSKPPIGPNRVAQGERVTVPKDAILLPLMLVYGAASLLHFVHNAAYLQDYPNLPAWLTSAGVFAAWLVVAAVGVLGYLIYTLVSRAAGLITIGIYALLGFGGLDHYAVAPVFAHTVTMNLTILLEVAAAGALLVCVARCAFVMALRRMKASG